MQHQYSGRLNEVRLLLCAPTLQFNVFRKRTNDFHEILFFFFLFPPAQHLTPRSPMSVSCLLHLQSSIVCICKPWVTKKFFFFSEHAWIQIYSLQICFPLEKHICRKGSMISPHGVDSMHDAKTFGLKKPLLVKETEGKWRRLDVLIVFCDIRNAAVSQICLEAAA